MTKMEWLTCLGAVVSWVSVTLPMAIKLWKDAIRKNRRDDAIEDDRDASATSSDDNCIVDDDTPRDNTRYTLNGSGNYSKCRLVLAVITEYAKKNRGITYDELCKTFPKKLRGVKRENSHWGCVNLKKDAVELYEETGRTRHFTEDAEVIHLSDGTEVVVSSQWGRGNIGFFIEAAKDLGFDIKPR